MCDIRLSKLVLSKIVAIYLIHLPRHRQILLSSLCPLSKESECITCSVFHLSVESTLILHYYAFLTVSYLPEKKKKIIVLFYQTRRAVFMYFSGC